MALHQTLTGAARGQWSRMSLSDCMWLYELDCILADQALRQLVQAVAFLRWRCLCTSMRGEGGGVVGWPLVLGGAKLHQSARCLCGCSAALS
jgi:hypothetical protein